MRIALDATPLTEATGGVHRYTAELCRALAENFPDDEYWLLSDQEFENPCPAMSNVKKGRGPQNLIERRWWLWGLQGEISRYKVDLFHGTDFAVPYLPVRPSVMTLHDLSPWLNPTWHAEADRVRTRTPMLLRLGLATMVVTPSEAVRRQAMERFRIQAHRMIAVPLAAADLFRPVPAPVESGPFFLYVGTLEPRKNLHFLLDAWRELRKTHPVDLVLAGRRRSDFQELDPEPGLRLLGGVADAELPALYTGAVALVYPSHYEGFGLPVLEAMQCGCAVITSKDPAISEVAGGACVQLDSGDVRAWVEAMSAALSDSSWIAGLREQSLRRAADFSWAKTARATREVYGEAVRRFRRKS
jgi:glycosyltransferase involved in cell wall biosynthesis